MPMDLSKFKGTLPYDSQMYGIYQPLLGWKSLLQQKRVKAGISFIKNSYLSALTQRYVGNFTIQSAVADAPKFELSPGQDGAAVHPPSVNGIDSLVTQRVVKAVMAGGNTADSWAK